MADTKSRIALNIGSQRISMGVFAPGKKGGLVLKGYASDVILADPSTDPSRLNKVRDVVANLSSRLKLGKSSKISYCLLYTSDAADDTPCVDLGGRRIIKKKKK